ncbi:iron chaperone [Arundinibacter roseus]|uniref:YdhG-like domain-containing protein n=1 Tax=Arundinibacter roseus TaxID=2070510 RepID=A0A4R4K4M8_9BACT|nr:DUF1801 domain-containing protein [Arundinibacter roseus]TDB62358.1 hypothetical protein EZE20_18425 [Arundinibacter roseus]
METSLTTIEEYIARCPESVQPLLQIVRQTIRGVAPEATETINYGIPTFVQHGNLVHFAACKNHLGFYPGPSIIKEFAKELAPYTTSKGSVQFPYTKSLPLDLIAQIVQFRVEENVYKFSKKVKKK